jgi:hypothetical protein
MIVGSVLAYIKYANMESEESIFERKRMVNYRPSPNLHKKEL